MHISGLWTDEKVYMEEKKVDIQSEKVYIEEKKVDIETLPSPKSANFSARTNVHIQRLFHEYSYDGIFGRSAVMDLLGLKSSGTSKLLSNLVQAGIIEPVS